MSDAGFKGALKELIAEAKSDGMEKQDIIDKLNEAIADLDDEDADDDDDNGEAAAPREDDDNAGIPAAEGDDAAVGT